MEANLSLWSTTAGEEETMVQVSSSSSSEAAQFDLFRVERSSCLTVRSEAGEAFSVRS